ncbi:unnamed protein product, partial [Ectocarpus sp. 13 AM-2016]
PGSPRRGQPSRLASSCRGPPARRRRATTSGRKDRVLRLPSSCRGAPARRRR